MRRRLLLLFALLFSLGLSAERIPFQRAEKIAMDFFKQHSPQLMVTSLQMVYDGKQPLTRSADFQPALYLFNNPKGNGFVVVSGDDTAYPILGYSFENTITQGDFPPNMKEWLEEMEKQVIFARENGYKGDATASSEGIGEVVKQLLTAKWNQGTPYNNECPIINGDYAWTGCTITAAAIVMRYHQWPEKGEGTIPAYKSEGDFSIDMPARPLGHTYDWKNMPLTYEWGQYTAEQAKQVSVLMADLGSMLQATYGTEGTGAATSLIAQNLPVYMDYDKGAIQFTRDRYDSEDWYKLIKDEIYNERPVVYSGFNQSAGHAFVLDGYTSQNYFSVNWGWGGYCNGYFKLDALVPDGSGIGGNDDHYNFNQAVVVGLKPDEGGDYVYMLSMGSKGMSSSVTEFYKDTPFVVNVDMIINTGGTNFTGKVLCALAGADDSIKEEYAMFNVNDLPIGWGYSDVGINVGITETIEQGDRIRLYYRRDNETQWHIMKGGPDAVWELLLTEEFTLDASTSLTYDKETKEITVISKSGATLSFKSSNGTDFTGRCKTDGKTTTIGTDGLANDTYTLTISKGSELKELKIKLNPSK